MPLKLCIDCRQPAQPAAMRKGRCRDCLPAYDARNNAQPARRVHFSAAHRRLAKLVKARDGSCRHCGATEQLTVDYIIPLSRGGTMTLDNAQTLCRACNARKGNRVAL
jgi:5-methylcytosine-specific restriction enzyme A